jgi:ABC-type dipeptide/oligopeptide/nickel transport system permease component
MSRFILRRFLWLFIVLFIVSIITFVLMHAVPGGPFSQEKALPPAVVANLNKKYHLDDPFIVQYLSYIGDIVMPRVTTGKQLKSLDHDYLINIRLPGGNTNEQPPTFRWMNFGPSFKSSSQTVNDIFRDNLPVSFQLGVAALIIAMCIGIPLGIMSALRRNTSADYLGMGVAIFGVSVPVIITAPVLQYIFGVQMKVVPVSGWGNFQQMILPAFALGFTQSALLARLTRASLLQVMNEDYIRTARAKGLSEQIVIIRHAFKNGMIPVITILGPLFAALVTGTFVVETIFGIPGMGRFFVTSITGRDYPVIMGTILLYAIFLVLANMAVDLMYAWLDPRIRFD